MATNKTRYKYIPESELEDNKYYYVHTEGPEYRGTAPKKVEIRQWLLHGWVCNGLGSAGNWLAIEEVPELDVDKYEIREEK